MITEERLKEIIEKSGFTVRGNKITVSCRCDDVEISDDLMQLVRRVVIECAEKVEDLWDHEFSASEYADRLIKHFGIEK